MVSKLNRDRQISLTSEISISVEHVLCMLKELRVAWLLSNCHSIYGKYKSSGTENA